MENTTVYVVKSSCGNQMNHSNWDWEQRQDWCQVRIQDLVGGGLYLPTARSAGVRAKRAYIGRGPGPALGPWKLLYF